MDEAERLALRGVRGSPQYAAVNTRPDISSKLSFLQSAINNAKVETLQEANKLLHEAKKHHQDPKNDQKSVSVLFWDIGY